MGGSYMSEARCPRCEGIIGVEGCECSYGADDDSPFDGFELGILCNMEDPPGEAFETSYRRAQELLEEAGPRGAILLLTITDAGEDLVSSVVLSSGYQRIPTHLVLSILDTHLEALGEGPEG